MIAHNPDGFQLDADGFAVPQADILADWYIEHSDDPDEDDPADWPETPEIDGYVWTLGPDPDQLPLTDQADLEDLLRALPCTPWQNFLSTPGELE